jgi:hypothetical protein
MVSDDQNAYELAQSYSAFANGPAGKDLLNIFLPKLEQGALAAIQMCSDYSEAQGLLIRYQQRKAVVDAIEKYIQNQVDLMNAIREESNTNGNYDDNA